MQALDFVESCFAEGTRIRRGDGSLEAVERFEMGDKVVADSQGTSLTVVGITKGGEKRALVNLYDDMGNDLLLTEAHPVVTAHRGILPAAMVQEGDQVITESGVSIIVSAIRVHYDGPVYNLSLGTPEELQKVGDQGRTMFADGFLVGDKEMQTDVTIERSAAASTTSAVAVASVPAAWRKDFEFDRDHKAGAKARK